MSAPCFRPRSLLASAPVLILTVLWCADVSAGRTMRAGDKYKSPTGLFRITVPEACSPLSLPYVVDQAAKKRGNEAWEEASFYIHDMGELYRVGMFRLTPELRALVKEPEGPLSLPALAWFGVRTHLAERAQDTGDWKPVSELGPVHTPHGSGVLSVNDVERGRFLEGYTGDRPLSGPAVVVVLVVQRGNDVLFVTGQADGAAVTGGHGSAEQCLRRGLQNLANGMVLAPRAVGDR